MPRLPVPSTMPLDDVVIVAAAIVERNGRFLLTRRLEGTHLEGTWEFPGGKCDHGETLEACLARELREELAVNATVQRLLLVTRHSYAERTVELHFFEATIDRAPTPQLGQEMRWASRDELATLAFPDADRELIELLMARDTRPD
jgi:mutator protein MutT